MKNKTTFIIIGAVVIVLLAVLWLFSRNPKTVFACAEAGYADISSTLTVSGKITPDREIGIKPHISAYVSAIHVKTGDRVRKGQLLMTLTPIPDASLLEEADAEIKLQSIALEQAKVDFERAEKLFEGGSIPRKEYEAARNALAAAKERSTLAANRRRIIVNGGSARSAQNNASRICSPVDGVVAEIAVDEGETVSPSGIAAGGSTLCKIADNGPLVFKGDVDEIDVVALREGIPVNIVLGALPDKVLTGELTSISSFGQTRNGFTQFEIKASVVSVPEGVELRSGYSANAKIETGRVENVLAVPEECIRFDENLEPYVLRLISSPGKIRHQRWEPVPVTLGISDGQYYQIESGLEEGDLVQSKTEKTI